MIRAALFLFLAASAFAGDSRERTRDSTDWSRESRESTDWSSDWSSDTTHQSVPEASPTLALALAGAALILRRKGGAK
jgi:hypothetical protein